MSELAVQFKMPDNHLGSKLAGRKVAIEVASPLVVVVVHIVIAVLVIGVYLVSRGSRQVAAENGLLENLQQLWLALAGMAFAAQFYRRSAVQPRERSVVLVALCSSFLLRESDVSGSHNIAWLTYWVDESGKAILMGVTWLSVFLYLSSRRPFEKLIRSNIIFDTSFRLLLASFLMLIVGWAYDRKHVVSSIGLPIEEQSEVIAYSLILLAGLDVSVPTQPKA